MNTRLTGPTWHGKKKEHMGDKQNFSLKYAGGKSLHAKISHCGTVKILCNWIFFFSPLSAGFAADAL